jgi:hypothetical protein
MERLISVAAEIAASALPFSQRPRSLSELTALPGFDCVQQPWNDKINRKKHWGSEG